jgi:hypothetical protein
VLLAVKVLVFFLSVLRYFVSGVCLFFLKYLSLVFSYWVCWVRGNFSGGSGHIYFVCVTPLCGVPGRYDFIWALSWSGWRDCTDFSFFLWLCCSGYGTVEIVRGGWSVFLFTFFSLLSVLLAVGYLW